MARWRRGRASDSRCAYCALPRVRLLRPQRLSGGSGANTLAGHLPEPRADTIAELFTMAAKSKQKARAKSHEPTIENRKARHQYFIEETLECGIKLLGTEIKAVREGKVSIGEGYVRAEDPPGGSPSLKVYGMHIGEYAPAGPHRQHHPTHPRILLAHRREISKLATKSQAKGVTLVPLKLYFVRGHAKLLIGVARGKRQADKRQDLAKRDAQRDIDRAMSQRR